MSQCRFWTEARSSKGSPRLRSEFGVEELYLFGSVARGDAHPDSDVDVLVSYSSAPSLGQFLDLADFLEEALQSRADLVTMSGAKPRLLRRIQQEVLRAA